PLGDRTDGTRLGDRQLDEPGCLAAEAFGGRNEQLPALGLVHAAPGPAVEGLASRAGRVAHLLGRALRSVAGRLFRSRIDDGVAPARGGDPPAPDQDLV